MTDGPGSRPCRLLYKWDAYTEAKEARFFYTNTADASGR